MVCEKTFKEFLQVCRDERSPQKRPYLPEKESEKLQNPYSPFMKIYCQVQDLKSGTKPLKKSSKMYQLFILRDPHCTGKPFYMIHF